MSSPMIFKEKQSYVTTLECYCQMSFMLLSRTWQPPGIRKHTETPVLFGDISVNTPVLPERFCNTSVLTADEAFRLPLCLAFPRDPTLRAEWGARQREVIPLARPPGLSRPLGPFT